MNSSGAYSTISMEQVISSVKMNLRIESGDDDLYIFRFANEGARHFDSLDTFIKRNCTLDINDGKAKLPNGFHQLLAMRPHGTFQDSNLIYVDQPWLTGQGINSNGYFNGAGAFQINDGYIYFTLGTMADNHGVNATGDYPIDIFGNPVMDTTPLILASSIEIAFIGMNVDDNGFIRVYSDMERGLIAYISYKYVITSTPGKFSPMQIADAKQEWIAQKHWYKSKVVQDKFRNTKRQVASLANAYIANKNFLF